MKKNRWLIALSAIFIHMSIGSAYAYSVFKKPLQDQFGWDSTYVSLAFTIAIFCLGMSAAFFGTFVEKYGPRASATVAAILFSAGMIGSGVAIHFESLYGFLAMYGVCGGMGLGMGYISPVSTLVKWFPDRRGLATGMAVMGFGAGSLIAAPIANRLIETVGISNTFYILGSCYFVLMISGALYIARPPEGWMPASMKAAAESTEKNAKPKLIKQDLAQLTAKEAVKTKRFWLLWLMMFINISCGLMLLSVASPLAQDKVGMTAAAASSVVAIMGFFNGGGRLGWATVSDYMGRTNTYTMFFIVQLAAFLLLPSITNALLFQILLFLIISMYGGGFACLPAYIGDLFGTKQLGAIHGYLLTSWSMAAIAGPMIIEFAQKITGGYDAAFYVISGMIAVAFIASLFIRANIKQIHQATVAQVAATQSN